MAVISAGGWWRFLIYSLLKHWVIMNFDITVDSPKRIKERLDEFCKERSLSYKQLANSIGTKPMNLSSSVSRGTTWPIAISIEYIYGIRAEWLMSGKGLKCINLPDDTKYPSLDYLTTDQLFQEIGRRVKISKDHNYRPIDGYKEYGII